MGTFEDFRPESNYFHLIKSFQYLLDQSLHELSFYPFENPLLFNATVLQKYEKGSIGITPHRDSLRYINLVCIFIISGQGKFFVCSNRLGSDAVELNATVGNVIILRAPGFLHSNKRPFHYVTDILETRYTFGLRHMNPQEFPAT